MFTASYTSPRTAADRNSHVLRTIGSCRYHAAHRLAAEEQIQLAIEAADIRRLRREAGMAPVGVGASLASLRRLTGSALIRFGERLHGRSVVAPVAKPMTTV
jgi:hypothetical protein